MRHGGDRCREHRRVVNAINQPVALVISFDFSASRYRLQRNVRFVSLRCVRVMIQVVLSALFLNACVIAVGLLPITQGLPNKKQLPAHLN